MDYDSARFDKDMFFRDSPHSPLTATQAEGFEGLAYFDANPALALVLEVSLLDGEEVPVPTSTGTVHAYARWGEVRFTVDGIPCRLTVYKGAHGLFLPFADSLAGSETYGAGRYVEPEELPNNRIFVDFNLAYNPYCAYNDGYSCPLTPAENRLKAPIRAGERTFRKKR